MRLRNFSRQLSQWVCAIIVAFFVVNMICFAYERPPGWFDTPNGASDSVREPYSILVHGTEGYAITRIDRNGFTNPDKDLAENYVLMMGASHSQGKEVASNKKYSVLVNDYLAEDELLHTYNIASDGSYLPSQIKHFKSAVQAFPNAYVTTIEISGTDFSVDELENALNQSEYKESDSAIHFSGLSSMEKLRNIVKSYIPVLSKIKKSIEALKEANAPKSEFQVDVQEYSKVINECLAQIRSESEKPIVFIYHPETKIMPDGSMSLKYSSTWEIFRKACDDNGIDLIDSGEDFIEYYDKYRKVPYGFSNTSFDNGHLNEVGHNIIAEEIIDYLEEIKQ